MIALKPGTLFARDYEVVRVISAGGMGVVFEVVDLKTRRRRALKVMLPHVVTEPEMRERFALEAVVTSDIVSEHIVEIISAGIDAETDSPYIVMELLRGEDLAARFRRGERYTVEETLLFVDQVARTLQKTHAQGIVHRDLKPENLFVTERDDGSPRIKILDFGIAKIVKASVPDPKSTTKAFGTPFYMAREQVTGEANLIGPSSDLYALAHIVFAMLVGTPYFEDEASRAGGNMLTLLLAVGRGASEPASVRAERRGVTLPHAFDAWFSRATDIDPRRRFGDAKEMMGALRAALAEPIRYASTPPPCVASADTPVAVRSEPQTPSEPAPTPLGGTIPMAVSQSTPPRASVPAMGDASVQTASPQSVPAREARRAVQGGGRGRFVGLPLGAAALGGLALFAALRAPGPAADRSGSIGPASGAPASADPPAAIGTWMPRRPRRRSQPTTSRAAYMAAAQRSAQGPATAHANGSATSGLARGSRRKAHGRKAHPKHRPPDVALEEGAHPQPADDVREDRRGDDDALAGPLEHLPDDVVLGEHVRDAFEAAEGAELAAREQHRLADHRGVARERRERRARRDEAGELDALELGAERRRALADEEVRHESDPRIRRLHRRQLGDVVLGRADVAVADEHEVVRRVPDHPEQIAHLGVLRRAARVDDELRRDLGVGRHERLDDRDRRIVGPLDAEQDFEPSVSLPEEALEVVAQVGVRAAERLEHRDGRQRIAAARDAKRRGSRGRRPPRRAASKPKRARRRLRKRARRPPVAVPLATGVPAPPSTVRRSDPRGKRPSRSLPRSDVRAVSA